MKQENEMYWTLMVFTSNREKTSGLGDAVRNETKKNPPCSLDLHVGELKTRE